VIWIVSIPAPPSTTSRPSVVLSGRLAFQLIVSSPAPALIVSLPRRPLITSSPAVPVRVSAAAVPLIVLPTARVAAEVTVSTVASPSVKVTEARSCRPIWAAPGWQLTPVSPAMFVQVTPSTADCHWKDCGVVSGLKPFAS